MVVGVTVVFVVAAVLVFKCNSGCCFCGVFYVVAHIAHIDVGFSYTCWIPFFFYSGFRLDETFKKQQVQFRLVQCPADKVYLRVSPYPCN